MRSPVPVRRLVSATAACLLWGAMGAGWAQGLEFLLDYTYDAGFFTDPAVNPSAAAARAALEHATRSFEMYRDSLREIRSDDPQNVWDMQFRQPDTGQTILVPGGVVPADTLIVYVGARDMGEFTLGQGGPGGFTVKGISQEWADTVVCRGQTGAAAQPATDFGPWGGALAFNSSAAWSFDIAGPPAEGEVNDFLSVATHELCHLLGFGTAASWRTYVAADANMFQGPSAAAAYGGAVPLDAPDAHWREDVDSTVGGAGQEPAMTPQITVGTRKRLTALDRAGLADVGWEMPLAGDADHDGAVDVLDYLTAKRSYGRVGTATWSDGDFDDDGDVDRRDVLAMKEQFGQRPDGPAAASGGAAAPEPATAALLAGAAAGLLLRRRAQPSRRRGRHARCVVRARRICCASWRAGCPNRR